MKLATILVGCILAGSLAATAQTPKPGPVPPKEGPAKDATTAADQTEFYPPIRHPTAVHAFSLPDEIKADVVRKALAELSTKDAECRIVYGPVKATARPNKVFIVIEAPAALEAKDVAKALKKGVASAEIVAWTCFVSADKSFGSGLDRGMAGMSPRDWVLGMSNDLRWIEGGGGWSEFFFAPGKLTPETIADRFHKLAQPFGVKDLGHVVEESFTWSIRVAGAPAPAEATPPANEAPLDAAALKRAEKVLVHLPGVKSAHLDAQARTLSVTVVLADLVRGGPVLPMPGGAGNDPAAPGSPSGKPAADPDAAPPPRMRFDTNPLFDALEKEHFTAAPDAKKEGGDAGPKKGG